MNSKPPDVENAGGTQQQAGGEKPPEGGTPPPAGGAPAGASGGKQQPAPAGSQQPDPKPREIGADDPEPKPREMVTLTTEALDARISRASKAAVRASLKETFGVEDPAVLKAQLDEANKLKAKEDEKRRSELAEIDRVKEDNQRLLARATNAEAQVAEFQEMQALAGDEQEIAKVANEFLDPEYWDVTKAKLADHLASNYSADELDALSEKDREKVIRDFCEEYAKKKPALALKKPEGAGGGGTQQQAGGGHPTPSGGPERRPLQNGGANPRGKGDTKPPEVIQSGKYAGKTAAPGHPNSMTKAEYQAWLRDTGNTY
jgi:hypothetical protein